MALFSFGVRAGEPAKKALVVVYDGWGTPSSFLVSGRVLEDKGSAAPTKKSGSAANLFQNLQDLESDEIPNANLTVVVGGRSFAATADRDGVFVVVVKNLPATESLPAGTVEVTATLTTPTTFAGVGRGVVHVHGDDESLGLISDIDDTVVQTFVPDKKRMLAEVLLKNATQLVPVKGAAANYQQARDAGVTAFFYVSGSPQNFYLRLRRFLGDHGLPAGPILLKNLGDDSLFGQDDYKLTRIEKILAAFPKMRFVLVGDSGERDPEIYQMIRGRHPERIAGIVIRKAPGSKHTEPDRFNGCVTFDDAYGSDDVVAAALPARAVPIAPVTAPLTP